MKDQTALSFYKEIEEVKEDYKLINGLFIVKYVSEEICYYVGDFLKRGNVFNPSKNNKVKINRKPLLKYDSKNKVATTNLGTWKKLNISFEEMPIGEILK